MREGGTVARWRRRRVAIPAAAAFLVAMTAAGTWWWQSGTRLVVSSDGMGVPAPLGVPLSAGIELSTDSGSSVVLDNASADLPAGVRVDWSVFRNGPGTDGFGNWVGPLAPTYLTGRCKAPGWPSRRAGPISAPPGS